MGKEEWYVIGIITDKKVENYVEEIRFKNGMFNGLTTALILPTKDLRLALKIESKSLADHLAWVTQKAFPSLDCKVILMTEDWWKQ